jgi:hypothetical protein
VDDSGLASKKRVSFVKYGFFLHDTSVVRPSAFTLRVPLHIMASLPQAPVCGQSKRWRIDFADWLPAKSGSG